MIRSDLVTESLPFSQFAVEAARNTPSVGQD